MFGPKMSLDGATMTTPAGCLLPAGAGAGTWLQLLSFTLDNIQISTQFEERAGCCWQDAVVRWCCGCVYKLD